MRTVRSVLEELEREGSWMVYVDQGRGFSPKFLAERLSEKALTASAIVEQAGGCIGRIAFEVTLESPYRTIAGSGRWRMMRFVSCSEGRHSGPEELGTCDSWSCLCGNQAHLDGFDPIEPVDVTFGNLRCGRCGRVVSPGGVILSPPAQAPDALVERWG